MDFEWDHTKNLQNQRKHGLSFEEASQLFDADEQVLEIFDASHSIFEDRYIAIGPISRGMVVVVYTEPEESLIRIISARWTNEREQMLYRSRMGERE